MTADTPARVAVIRCDVYDVDKIESGLARALELLGGIDAIVKARGETAAGPLLVKPNLLAAEQPGSVAVTHHAVFEAVCRALRDGNRRMTYGDSPAIHSTAAAARSCGIRAAADRVGVEEVSFRESDRTVFEGGNQNKVFPIARACRDAAAIVNVAKLKTHGFMTMTAAVKNMFGCVSGLEKARFHARLEDPRQFARMIVDLCLYLSPPISIVDAIDAMEGNGPRNGSPFHIGAILVSTDPVAADTVGARLLGIDPAEVPTIAEGHGAGLGSMTNIELVGDPLPRPSRKAVPARGKADLNILPRMAKNLLRRIWVQSPVIDTGRCIRCYECVKICPTTPKSIVVDAERYPRHRYETCIRCYCCQETCPANAIAIRHKLFV